MTATITKAWIAMVQTLAAAPTRYCRNIKDASEAAADLPGDVSVGHALPGRHPSR
jgi:hypothetical protein